jgi:hypothetical protein
MSVFSRPIVQAVRSVERVPFFGRPKVQSLADVYSAVNFTTRLDAPYGTESDCRIVVRDDLKNDGGFPTPLSTRLTPAYNLVQHRTFVEQFVEPYIGHGGAEIVHTRLTDFGARFSVTLKLGEELKLSAHDSADIGNPYLTLFNGCDGMSGISMNLQILRKVCVNGAVRFVSKKMAKRKHYGKCFQQKLGADFVEIAGLLEEGREVAEFYRQLSDKVIADDHRPLIDKMLVNLLGDVRDEKSKGARAERRWAEYRSVINSDRADEDTYGGVLQAVYEMIDHHLERRVSDDVDGGVDSNRFKSLVGGADEKLKAGWAGEMAELAGLSV